MILLLFASLSVAITIVQEVRSEETQVTFHEQQTTLKVLGSQTLCSRAEWSR